MFNVSFPTTSGIPIHLDIIYKLSSSKNAFSSKSRSELTNRKQSCVICKLIPVVYDLVSLKVSEVIVKNEEAYPGVTN